MRAFLLMLLALGACSEPQRFDVDHSQLHAALRRDAERQVQTEEQAEAERQWNRDWVARREAGQGPKPTREEIALARGVEADARTRAAAIICRERGTMAATQPAFGGFGLAGAISAGMQQGWAGANQEAACMRAYQATGIMPSF